MHPAPSIILFTVLSGLGLGLLCLLGLGLVMPTGWAAFWWFGLGYGLTLAGLGLSAFHLGHPERALKAFTQWRTSWLSREAVLATAALLFMAPHAAGLVFWATPLRGFGLVGAFLSLQTVLATAMIYAQLRTVPRWNQWTTPVLFLSAALAGGAIVIGAARLAALLLVILGLALLAHWWIGDRRFGAAGSNLGTATGLGARGRVRQLEGPHTGTNYLLREMVHVVARKHALKLRIIALACAAALPALILSAAPGSLVALCIAVVLHVAGMLASRWLFFAEAEHVVGLYYGHHGR
ncbi:MAG: DMSO reductase anchor subunit [Rhodobacteraceae bacterium HLUCCA12]|nr:MAG: DMSO reductase anchor subunit [Rhodobacteraceae bacterium HLUCCA12]